MFNDLLDRYVVLPERETDRERSILGLRSRGGGVHEQVIEHVMKPSSGEMYEDCFKGD